MKTDLLDKFLLYAEENVPFYRSNDNHTRSIINKNDVIMNSTDFINTSVEANICNYTSGTTGQPMRIEWNISDYQSSYYQLWKLRKKWYGITPLQKSLQFHTITTNGTFMDSNDAILDKNTLSIRRDAIFREGFDNYIDIILEFNPDWILIAPSMMVAFTKYLKERKIVLPRLRYIELNGETVQPNEKEFIEKSLGVQVANLYGAIEFNGIALSCPCGQLHILDQNVYVESNDHSLVITTLTNRRMPLIKYRIGDQGDICSSSCCCGYSSDVIINLCGRMSENIVMNGLIIPKSIFSSLIEEINRFDFKVMQYQIVADLKINSISLKMQVLDDYYSELRYSKLFYCDYIVGKINPVIDIKIDIELLRNKDGFIYSGVKFRDLIYLE